MSFLSGLGDLINEQFGFGESTVSSLDNVGSDGRVQNFGLLGEFANKIDRSADRSYTEDGIIGTLRPRLREVFFQQPDISVIFKKKMFSSLSDNSRLDLLEPKEQLLITATKKLIQNKIRLLAHYERLTKIEAVTKASGQFNTELAPMLMDAVSLFPSSIISPSTRAVFDTLRKALAFSESPEVSTYSITSFDDAFDSFVGEGPGTFEITTITNVSSSVGVELGSGSASITIEDPYKILVVKDADITQALNDSTNFFKNSFFGRFTERETENLILSQRQQLDTNRGLRNVSRIRFVTEPTSVFSKKIRAIMDGTGREIIFQYNGGLVGIGAEVEIDDTFLGDGPNQLNGSDANLFRRIIKNQFLLFGFQNTTQSQIKKLNKDQNYTRRRMRQFFQGRPIIQPMDVVNIFMTSRTLRDEKVVQGMQNVYALGGSKFAIGQKFDQIFNNINATITNINGVKGDNRPEELEKNLIAGPGFPMWLWRMFRNDFTRQSAGVSTFVGLVKSAPHSFQDGKYVLKVECEDNSGYFEKSQINIKPALDESNSVLYDPLTPFDLSFDAATGASLTDFNLGEFPPLLLANRNLLASKAVRFPNGRLRGQAIDEALFKTSNDEIGFGGVRRILSDPNGFVYRWKQGIQSLTKTERAFPQRTSLVEDRSPQLTKNPFAGQDVMNVLSLLITGEPYNYNSFLRSALANANSMGSYDPTKNEPASVSYIQFLTNQLQRRNAIYGNFVPFKKLVVNEATDQFIRTAQSDFLTQQTGINSLMNKRAQLFDQLIFQTGGAANNPNAFRKENGQFVAAKTEDEAINNTSAINSRREIASIDREIDNAQQNFMRTIEKQQSMGPKGSLQIIGDDVKFDTSLGGTNKGANDEQRLASRKELRKKLTALTLRRLWKVKANDDVSYFIVDDQYDSSFDIQAFDRAIQFSTSLFNNEYTTILEKIKSVQKLLGLEVFADTQGHIQVRPPAYNKIPSSVFYDMFRRKQETGIQVFPQFLESLFTNQIQGLANRIEIVEDQIRLRVTALGIFAGPPDIDSAVRNFLSTGQDSVAANQFLFITDGNTGRLRSGSFQKVMKQSRPDETEEDSKNSIEDQLNALEDVKSIASNATKLERQFDSVTRISAFRTFERAALNDDLRTQNITDRVSTIRDRLFQKTGEIAPTQAQLLSNSKFKRLGVGASQLDALTIINNVSSLVSERQKLLISLANAAKNLKEGLSFNSSDDGSENVLFPSLFSNETEVPSIMQHMIEDEDEDDIGIGSSKRFVLRDSMYSSLTISETPPPFNIVAVNGLLGDGFVNPPGGLQTPSDGNAVTTAYAVDYDSWYQYGARQAHTIQAPFFSDPDSQCAPYATFQLLMARKNILQGSVTVNVYNEYYQPGDVVYIEDRDLLFYVDNVSHSFSYGSLNTTLKLTYGHPPGEYLPTILDVVGKIIYNAKGFTGQFRSTRFDDPTQNEISLGSFIVEHNAPLASPFEELISGSRGELNRKLLSNLLLGATGVLNPVGTSGEEAKIELRVYGENGGSDTFVTDSANAIIEWLIAPAKKSGSGGDIISEDLPFGFAIPKNKVSVVIVDINDGSSDSPSNAAWNSVRMLEGSKLSGQGGNLDTILKNSIIDAFVVFSPPEERVTSLTQSTLDALSEGEVLSDAKVKAALAAARNSEEG